MLFRLKMDIETAIRAYRELTEKVASVKSRGVIQGFQALRSSRLKGYFLEIMKKHLRRVGADNVEVKEMRMLENDLKSMA